MGWGSGWVLEQQSGAKNALTTAIEPLLAPFDVGTLTEGRYSRAAPRKGASVVCRDRGGRMTNHAIVPTSGSTSTMRVHRSCAEAVSAVLRLTCSARDEHPTGSASALPTQTPTATLR